MSRNKLKFSISIFQGCIFVISDGLLHFSMIFVWILFIAFLSADSSILEAYVPATITWGLEENWEMGRIASVVGLMAIFYSVDEYIDHIN